MEKLTGKTVLIAGATGGIGRETAHLLASSGAHLFLLGRNQAALEALGTELRVSANHLFVNDITQAHDVESAAARIHAEIGHLDVLVNAVGIGIIKPLESLTNDDFMQSLNVNLVGAFNLLKAFLPPMKEQKKGLIINLPGVLGKTPMAGAAAYSASKYGLNGMLKSVREELKRTDIRITNIFLGGTDTPFWDTIDLRVQRDKFVTAQEAARAIWFLCQQPSSGVVSEMVLQPFNHQAI
ncbi:MAG: SDR family oxidoreductase [Candidatus Kapabacteria bacterium]|jgi:NADP-dependent 3-hydroxy acid dehydrogenase YdfG|nr:SDR family oxidoreductase [Candidatus Kapabacteria bacterium]